jgi:hypothetical protein
MSDKGRGNKPLLKVAVIREPPRQSFHDCHPSFVRRGVEKHFFLQRFWNMLSGKVEALTERHIDL